MKTVLLLESLKSQLSCCKAGVLSGDVPVYIPLGQARPRPPQFGQFHLQTELFYQISGETYFQFPTSDYILKPHHVLLVPPLVTHYEKVQGTQGSFQNLVAYASRKSCSVHFAKAGQDSRPAISYIQRRNPPFASHISEYLSDAVFMQESFHDCTGLSSLSESVQLLVSAALSHFLLALEYPESQKQSASSPRSDPWQEVSRGSVLVHEARERVLAAFSDKALSVQLIAEWLGCSADYLSHRFKSETTESLSTYINRIRVERAAELLNKTNLSVKEISWACGFAEESYFIKKFNETFGITPGLYRRTDRELLPAPPSRTGEA